MTKESQQIIREAWDKLPKEAQDIIDAKKLADITENIGKENSLNDEKIENFQTETLLALLGLTDRESYVENLESELEITKEQAGKLSKEVGSKIFIPLYESLKEKMKEKIKTRKPNWKQSLDFIMSGGDYTVFMDRPREEDKL